MTTTERYNQLKKSWPGAIVLMRCGDFYETYDEDARKCSELCGLTLTQRNGKAQVLTGFPYHALEGYVKKLHDAGRATVVCNDDFSNSTKINNNQKTEKTMEKEINFRTIRIEKAYMFNKKMECLVKVTLERVEYLIDSGKSTQTWRIANTDKKVMTSYVPATETEPEMFDGKLYHKLEDFEKGKVLTVDEIFYSNSNERELCSYLSQSVQADKDGAYIWAYEKGEAVKWYFRKHIDIVQTIFEEDRPRKWSANDDVQIPESYWSAEEVYKYHDYRFIDAEGKEQVHEGVLKRLFLEPDQKKLAKKLQAVIDECNAAGMCIYWSNCDYTLNAVNVRKIERIEYDPIVDEETEEAIYFDDSSASHTFKNVDDWNSEDSCIKFVIKK